MVQKNKHSVKQYTFDNHPLFARSSVRCRPVRDLVVSWSALLRVNLVFDSRSGLTKTSWIGIVAFMSGEQCAEELLGPSLEGNSLEVESESNDARPCRCAVVALQDRRCQKVPSKLYLKK